MNIKTLGNFYPNHFKLQIIHTETWRLFQFSISLLLLLLLVLDNFLKLDNLETNLFACHFPIKRLNSFLFPLLVHSGLSKIAFTQIPHG